MVEPTVNSLAVNDDISRLQEAISRVTGCASKYVEKTSVIERFHGFRGEVLWERDVHVFEIEGHPNASRVYSWTQKNQGSETATQVIVLEVPPVDSARSAIAAAMAASILHGRFEVC